MDLKQTYPNDQSQMQYSVKEKAKVLPVSVEDVEALNRYTNTSERKIAEKAIMASMDYIEQFLSLSVMKRTMLAYFHYPNKYIYLPFGASEIISVTSQSEAFTSYETHGLSDKYLELTSIPEDITIEYYSGWNLPSEVPASISTAIEKIAIELFENRGDSASVDANSISGGTWLEARRLVRPYKRNILL